MKHKVAELEGALLDAAVAMCEGLRFEFWDDGINCCVADLPKWIEDVVDRRSTYTHSGNDVYACDQDTDQLFSPSSFWQHGGPIIERERINLDADYTTGGDWAASMPDGQWSAGSAPLIAAMRAYVASKFGDEVELP